MTSRSSTGAGAVDVPAGKAGAGLRGGADLSPGTGEVRRSGWSAGRAAVVSVPGAPRPLTGIRRAGPSAAPVLFPTVNAPTTSLVSGGLLFRVWMFRQHHPGRYTVIAGVLTGTALNAYATVLSHFLYGLLFDPAPPSPFSS